MYLGTLCTVLIFGDVLAFPGLFNQPRKVILIGPLMRVDVQCARRGFGLEVNCLALLELLQELPLSDRSLRVSVSVIQGDVLLVAPFH